MAADEEFVDISEDMVERLAEQLYKNAVKEGRSTVAAQSFPLVKFETVFEEALKASDREAAIIVFCLVDDLAADFFKEKLTGKVSSGVDEAFLFGNGILASAYAKINLLAGLEWIRNETYADLIMLRKIRNEFAHHVELKTFSDNPIRGYIESMTHYSEDSILNTLNDETRPKKLSIRTKFLVRAVSAVYRLIHDLIVIQAAIAARVDPGSLVSGGWEDRPENVKNLLRVVSSVSIGAMTADASNPGKILRAKGLD